MEQLALTSQTEEPKARKAQRRTAENLVALGFAFSTIAFVLFFATNGASRVSSIVSLINLILIAFGLFCPAGGMLLLGRRKSLPRDAKRSLGLTGIGLASLFFAVILAAASSSLEFLLGSAAILTASAALTLVGVIMLRKNLIRARSRPALANFFIIGMLLLFTGASLIIAFNILGVTFYVPTVGALTYEDVGATVSSYGCLLGSYSFLRLPIA